MKKLLVIAVLSSFLVGCYGGLGFYKKCTLMPDEIWIGGDSNHDNEDSGEYSFGFKWKLK